MLLGPNCSQRCLKHTTTGRPLAYYQPHKSSSHSPTLSPNIRFLLIPSASRPCRYLLPFKLSEQYSVCITQPIMRATCPDCLFRFDFVNIISGEEKLWLSSLYHFLHHRAIPQSQNFVILMLTISKVKKKEHDKRYVMCKDLYIYFEAFSFTGEMRGKHTPVLLQNLWKTHFYLLDHTCDNTIWKLHTLSEKYKFYLLSCDKSQRDAISLKFILIKNFTYFREINCPSTVVSTLYTKQ